jgi:pimeloyl-ACP methyl ester carboxylesterase
LQARGWETEAVAFPTVGAEPPSKGVPDDAAAVRKVLEVLAEQGKQIVLVVHSYGGVVGAQAVRGLGYKQRQKEGKAGGIITYLYLSAFVVPVDQSLLKMLGGNWLPWMRVEVNSVAEAQYIEDLLIFHIGRACICRHTGRGFLPRYVCRC